jgi:hypothetical protein
MRGSARLEDLIYMFSFVTKMNREEAKALILTTETGKAVENGFIGVLYEQHTSNLESIITELKKLSVPCDITEQFTSDNIYDAMQELYNYDNARRMSLPIKYEAIHDTSLNSEHKEDMKRQNRKMLLEKNQDIINSRRMNRDANKIKR